MVKILAILVFVLINGLFLPLYVERRVAAYMQARIGPNRVGPKGLLQPVADMVKMLGKEIVIPKKADIKVFLLAPVLIFVPTLMVFAVIPFGRDMAAIDMNIGLFYFLAVASLSTLFIWMGGWASNSKYSLIEHKNKSTGEPQFYRFINPKSRAFMIELFSRRSEAIVLPEDAVLTPLPLDDELSSLSAILMDNEYYRFLLDGKVLIDGIPILDAGHLIPLKAKAWLDLSGRKAAGENVDSKNVRKHKNDVFRLSVLLTSETKITVPDSVYADISNFFSAMETGQVDLKQFEIRNQTEEEALGKIAAVYVKESSIGT